MNLIVCVEDKLGMMFNRRRQSQDRVLRERMLEMIGSENLCVSPYTAKQFEQQDRLTIIEDPQTLRGEQWCFIEDPQQLPPEDQISRIVVYRWNRAYPSDQYFPMDLSRWELTSFQEFAGYSHEKITEEVYMNEKIMD